MKSVQDQINNTPMSGFQVLAVTVCLAINMHSTTMLAFLMKQ